MMKNWIAVVAVALLVGGFASVWGASGVSSESKTVAFVEGGDPMAHSIKVTFVGWA